MLLISSLQVLFLGTVYTLSRKYQNIQLSPGLEDDPKHFYHPMYQVFWLFFGMALCLPFKNITEKDDDKQENKKEMNAILLIFPACMDVLATIFDAAGLYYVSI